MFTRVEISSHWKELFVINCKHSYYTNQVCKDLVMIPTDETKRLIRNYFLIYKPIVGGFKLIGNDPKSINLLKRDHEEGKSVKFSFLINSTKAEFINFTDLSVEPNYQNEVYHYSTKEVSKTKELQPVKIPTVTQKIIYTTTQPLTAKNVKLSDAFGQVHQMEAEVVKGLEKEDSWKIPLTGKTINVKLTPVSKKINSTTKKAVYTYSIDMRYLANGAYKLMVGTRKKETFSFYNLNSRRRNFGIIDVYLSELVNSKDQVIVNQQFDIQFQKRSTFWRYYLVQDKDVIYKNFKFFFQDNPIKTKLLKETKTLNNGKEALIFVSEGVLPLKEQMEKAFRMEYEKINLNIEDVKGGVGKGRKKAKLPTPRILAIKPEKNEKTKEQIIYSDIYFNL